MKKAYTIAPGKDKDYLLQTFLIKLSLQINTTLSWLADETFGPR